MKTGVIVARFKDLGNKVLSRQELKQSLSVKEQILAVISDTKDCELKIHKKSTASEFKVFVNVMT